MSGVCRHPFVAPRLSQQFSVLGLMVELAATRVSQLKADRDRTRAISAYLRERRASFESQLPKRARLDTNLKRRELVRLARVAFSQEPTSVQSSYLEDMPGSACSGATAVVEVQAAVPAAEPEASTMAAVRRRLRRKRKHGDMASSEAISHSLNSQTAKKQQMVGESGSRGSLKSPTTPLKSSAKEQYATPHEKAPTTPSHSMSKLQQEPREKAPTTPSHSMSKQQHVEAVAEKMVGKSGGVAGGPRRNLPPEGARAVTLASASLLKQNVEESRGVECSPQRSVALPIAATPASAMSSQQSFGELGRGTNLFLRSLPRCLTHLQRATGQADAAEILACATRILQKCPRLLHEKLPLELRHAVLFGVAAKMVGNSDKTEVAKIWGQFARRDFSTRRQIIALEAQAVQAIGRV